MDSLEMFEARKGARLPSQTVTNPHSPFTIDDASMVPPMRMTTFFITVFIVVVVTIHVCDILSI